MPCIDFIPAGVLACDRYPEELAVAMPLGILVPMEPTQSSLLVRLRDTSDNESWSEFYAIYEPFLAAVARRAGLAEQQVPDVVAAVFAICVRTLPEFEYDRGKGAFRGWLKTVTQRVVYDHWRKAGRQIDRKPLPDGVEPATTDDVWQQWDAAHREHVLHTALSAVQADSRQQTWDCFQMHILERAPAAKVAGRLGLKVNAVFTNASRVLSRVRAKCAEFDEDLSHA